MDTEGVMSVRWRVALLLLVFSADALARGGNSGGLVIIGLAAIWFLVSPVLGVLAVAAVFIASDFATSTGTAAILWGFVLLPVLLFILSFLIGNKTKPNKGVNK